MPNNQERVQISVVVAAPDAGRNLSHCLEALKAQMISIGGEILVVDGSRTGSTIQWSDDEKGAIRIIRLPAGTDVPVLWQAGIDASRGRIIALLVDSCVPGPDWASQILRVHRAEWAVVGGAIDLAPTLSLVDSAIYFCRYSRYMPPFAPHFLDDLPGNNCSYKRVALDGLQEEMVDGFWETFVHRKIRSRGDRLLCDPAIQVCYIGPSSGTSFFLFRFVHGRQFAGRQARGLSGGQRIVRALISPVVPFLMLWRIAVGVWEKGRHRTLFLVCVPVLTAFLAAWSAGEFLGYALGPAVGSFRKKKKTDSAKPSPASGGNPQSSAVGSRGA
jgi:glycosyltransferase involved in cell wall biosynthesis